MQQITNNEWVSSDGEWIVFTNGKVRVYNREGLIEIDRVNLPDEVQDFLDSI